MSNKNKVIDFIYLKKLSNKNILRKIARIIINYFREIWSFNTKMENFLKPKVNINQREGIIFRILQSLRYDEFYRISK